MTTDHGINEKALGIPEKAREAETHTETRVDTEQAKKGPLRTVAGISVVEELKARIGQLESEIVVLRGELSGSECDVAFWKERATAVGCEKRAGKS